MYPRFCCREGTWTSHDSATSEMCNVEVVCEGRVLKALNRFLKSNHVPLTSNVFFNGTFSASSRPRIPAQYAEACLLKQTVGHVVVETVLNFREESLLSWALRKTGMPLPEVTM